MPTATTSTNINANRKEDPTPDKAPAEDPLIRIRVPHYDPMIIDYGVVSVRQKWWFSGDVANRRWFLIKNRSKLYMVTPSASDGSMIHPRYAHREIMKFYQQKYGWQKERTLDQPGGPKYMVDHNDGNSLNNDPYNDQLRICTASENSHNRGKLKRNATSQYKGISCSKKRRKDGTRTFKIDFQYQDENGNKVRVREPSFSGPNGERDACNYYNELVKKHTNGFGRQNEWRGVTPDNLAAATASSSSSEDGGGSSSE